nr:hypothetical protein B0A51_08220 [Rachicladosporium sp. CCFEE 5018]
MAAVSPSSSPRLPSPPPIAEDQTSPGLSLFAGNFLSHTRNGDSGASRRIRPGTKADDMAEGPPLVDLQEIDSAFQLTEHLKALHYHHTHPQPDTSASAHTVPITPEIALELAHPPPGTAKEIWLYELARHLIQKTNGIIIALFTDDPPCSPQTCFEMRASEWQYLCAVHDPPKSCAAIDYCCHTLDWAASTLCNSKLFPSRLNLGTGGTQGDKMLNQQMKEITNIFRRVYRIYAHAWFQHREVFWRVEGKTGLYVFFKTVCDVYGLIQQENYTIPPEAEGLEPREEVGREDQQAPMMPSLLRRQDGADDGGEQEPAGNTIIAMGETTRRHRHTKSDMAPPITTSIAEEAEEEYESPAKPDLERAATMLPVEQKSEADDDAPAKDEEKSPVDEETDPDLGVTRSDTIKPFRDVEQSEVKQETSVKVEAEQEAIPEVTVVEVGETEEETATASVLNESKSPIGTLQSESADADTSAQDEAEVKATAPEPAAGAAEEANISVED